MEIKINKEIRDYTESIFMGLSMRQVFFSAIACISAVIIYFMAIDNVGMEITSWLCIFVSLPFAGLGFISYQGMNFERIMITALRSLLLTKQNLIFMPRNAYYELLKDKIKYYREESLNKNDKKLRKAKKTEQI